jgi:RNA polymerase sigma factor (sigma-70 family)
VDLGDRTSPDAALPMTRDPEDEFSIFFRKNFRRAVTLLRYYGASESEAADAAQDAMVALYGRYDDVNHPEQWVQKVAVRMWIRSRDRERQSRRREIEPFAVLARFDASADDAIATVEQVADVRAVVRGLPAAQREVFALHMDGFRLREIAERLGKPETTVRSMLRHARKSLRAQLDARQATDEHEVGRDPSLSAGG